jgi:hypothetical protein
VKQQTMNQKLSALQQMGVTQLRAKYLELFGEPTKTGNKAFLFKKLAWRIQSLAEGGLSERARRRAEELARDADIRTSVPKAPAITPGAAQRTVTMALSATDGRDRLPIPGTVLTRTYKGKHVAVTVLDDGTFDYEGQTYRSLSAIAKVITGSHWNGYLFFGLTTKGTNP